MTFLPLTNDQTYTDLAAWALIPRDERQSHLQTQKTTAAALFLCLFETRMLLHLSIIYYHESLIQYIF